MSLAEIKEALRQLTPEERREVVREIAALEPPQADRGRKAESFAEAKAYVFEGYGALLARLAE